MVDETPDSQSNGGWLWPFWWLWLLAGIAVLAGTVALDLNLASVRLQFAETGAEAAEILGGLDSGELTQARIALALDFLLIAIYTSFGYLACRRIPEVYAHAGARYQRIKRRGYAFGWAALLTGFFDALENVALLFVLSEPEAPSEFWATTAAAAAWTKWILLALVIGFIVVYGLRYLTSFATAQLTEFAGPDGDGPPAPDQAGADTDEALIGIACSGGGIRSAAFTLGALQYFQTEPEVWGRLTHLSAVSGGSYTAGSHSTLLTESTPPPAEPLRPGSPEERYLRNRTNYLAPGLRGKLTAFARWGRGVLLNLIVVTALLWVIARPVGWFISSPLLYPSFVSGEPPPIPTSIWWAIAMLLVLAFVFGAWPQVRRVKNEDRREGYFSFGDLLLRAAIILFVLGVAVPYVFAALGAAADALGAVGSFVVAAGTVAGLTIAVLRAVVVPYAARIASTVAALIVPVGLLVAFLIVANHAAERNWSLVTGDAGDVSSWIPELIVMAGAVLLLVFASRIEVANWSIHPFYKRRLAEAFALKVTPPNNVNSVPVAELKTLPTIAGMPQPPYELLVCAAANVSSGAITPPGRGALSFVFTPQTVGLTDQVTVGDAGTVSSEAMLEALGDLRKEDLSTMAAVAVSGAAVSPAMGRFSRRGLQSLLALMNLRLGVWYPNPMRIPHTAATFTETFNSPRVFPYFFKEMFAAQGLDDSHLYVTDGGHWDNLGVVELLRRRCKLIISLDAGGDKTDTFHGISQATSLAYTELGDEVDLDPARKIVVDEDGSSKKVLRTKTNYAAGEVRYRRATPEAPVETADIVYCKAVVTPDTPAAIRNYQERNRPFPHHSTALQLFDDERFEAYRSLGYYVAKCAYEGKIKNIAPKLAQKTQPPSDDPQVRLDDTTAELEKARARIKELEAEAPSSE